MTTIFLSLYRFFERNRVIMYILLLSSFVFFVYTGLKMEYEEDITRLLPQTKNDNGESLVFSNLKVKDKIYLVFKPKADSVTTDDLAEACESYMSTIMSRDSSTGYIADALYKVDQSTMMGALGFLMTSLPSYVTDEDYETLDSLTTEEHIKAKMAENYAMLFSPMGMIYKDIIEKDPIGVKDAFITKIGQIKEGLGGNYMIYNQHFFTPDSALAVAFISPGFASTDSKKSGKLVTMLDEEIVKFTSVHPDIDVYYHGAPIQSVYNSRQTKKDLASTLSVSMILICLVIWYCFRNADTLPMLLLPVVYGAFFALSTLYLIQGSMSLLALGIGGVVLGVALSYCLHVLVHYKYVTDPETVIKDQTVPVILGCLTTIGAFMSLMFTEADLLRDFGKFASLGLVGTTFFSLVFLPHFFSKERNKKNEKAFHTLESVNSYPFEKQTWLILSIIVISIICLFTKSWVEFDTDLKNIGYNEPKVIESQKILADHTTKDYMTVYYATIANDLDSGLVFNKELYKELEYQKSNNKIKSYGNTSALFVTKDEQKARIGKWDRYWHQKIANEKSREEIVRERLTKAGSEYGITIDMFDQFFDLINKKYEPSSLYGSDAIPSGLMSNMVEQAPDGKYILFTPVQMKKEDKNNVTDHIVETEVDGKRHFVIIDPFYYTNELVRIMHSDFGTTLGISSAFVFLVLLLSYKSIVLALIGFIPMTLSWYIVLGVMGVLGIEFNLVNIVISTFIYGIGVDYSIFIMDGLLSGFRTRRQLLVFHKTAILFSAFVLIVGIASLLFATHPAMKSIGFSTLVGMSATVIIAYSLQPFLFYWFIKRPTLRGRAPLTVANIFNPKSYFRQDGMNDKQKLINNYAYRGNEVENGLKQRLKETTQYKIFINDMMQAESVLVYGCGYGYEAYWTMLKNEDAKVTGFDTDDNDQITIANHCYLKNDQLLFSTDSSVINNTYYRIIINKNIFDSDNLVCEAIKNTKQVYLCKEVEDSEKFESVLKDIGFVVKSEDDVYTLYTKRK